MVGVALNNGNGRIWQMCKFQLRVATSNSNPSEAMRLRFFSQYQEMDIMGRISTPLDWPLGTQSVGSEGEDLPTAG
jgi:hypothetical protein